MIPIFDGLARLGASIIDNLFETEAEKADARAKLIKLQQEGRLKAMEQELSVMVAEAQSADPWTSRARPSFLYVIYAFIIAAIPMGILFAFSPNDATAITKGVGLWLNSIPESLWTLFGVGYLGYTGARSFDKGRIITKKRGR